MAWGRSFRHQWRPVIVPALALWFVGSVVSCLWLHPFDVAEYGWYAHQALQAPLLHRLPLEYPAPALVVFMFPLLLPFSYPWAFAVLAGLVLLFLVMSYEGPGVAGLDAAAARRLVLYLAVGASILVTARYDIFVAAATFWSVRAARRDRWSTAWKWSAVGCALKLVPAVLWPAFLIAECRRDRRFPWRRLAWMALTAAVLAVLPALFDRGGLLNVVHYYTKRPDEIEGVPAGLSLLLDWPHTVIVYSFHSFNLVNGVSRPMALAVEVGAGLGCLGAWWAQARSKISFDAVCLVTLTVAILGSKVGSAQYLIWLMPLWALYSVRREWLLASLVNLAAFPYSTSGGLVMPTHAFYDSNVLLLLVRNVLVAWGTWTWLRTRTPSEAPDSPVQSRPGGGRLPARDTVSEVVDSPGGGVRG